MGIANNLRRDEVGHILIGVDEDPTTKRGKVVGIQPGLDDASVQNAVKDWLVRMPRFSYGELQHDGHTVGSVEIRGEGRRPYYPVRASGSALAVNIARVRTGSSTTEACPHDIHRVVEAGQRCASRKASPRAEVAESGSAAVARIDVEASERRTKWSPKGLGTDQCRAMRGPHRGSGARDRAGRH
jgi:hypothetical protein